ncbi:MAG: glycosyltransferase family 2 protein, partial [Rhizomicrobium sp.]
MAQDPGLEHVPLIPAQAGSQSQKHDFSCGPGSPLSAFAGSFGGLKCQPAEALRTGGSRGRAEMNQLILLTTTDVQGGREAEFLRMIDSVRAGMRTGIRVKMFVLFQRADAEAGAKYQGVLPPGSVILTGPGRMSLSQARNSLLGAALQSASIGEDCVVGFPDDDCWYPPRFVDFLVASFRRDGELDMLTCRVSLQPVDPPSIESRVPAAKAWQVVRRSSSNSMFFRGATVAAIGPFDPAFGLGTPSGAGEDTDYALRALLKARRATYIDLPLVGHRES